MGLRRRARERAVQALYQLDGIQFSADAMLAKRAGPPLPRLEPEAKPAAAADLRWQLGGEAMPRVRRRSPKPAAAAPELREPAIPPPATLEEALDDFWSSFDPPESDVRELADPMIRGALEHRSTLDGLVEASSLNWRVERMARVDRNVLRLAVFELVHRSEVPTKVCLNEAIELARKFGSEDSSAFINGVLDKVAKAVRSIGDGVVLAPPEETE
ncbi:MAG: transcription antitermination factor NusB [Deltaproteobacteria bacterium]